MKIRLRKSDLLGYRSFGKDFLCQVIRFSEIVSKPKTLPKSSTYAKLKILMGFSRLRKYKLWVVEVVASTRNFLMTLVF